MAVDFVGFLISQLRATRHLGIGLLAVWQFAPSVFAEARSLLQPERLEMLVARAGLWGPVVIVTLMTLAVMASPIPSAPIALAAGAAYGHLWGTVQVVIGAELGALIAFGLTRVLEHDVLRRVLGDRIDPREAASGALCPERTPLNAQQLGNADQAAPCRTAAATPYLMLKNTPRPPKKPNRENTRSPGTHDAKSGRRSAMSS